MRAEPDILGSALTCIKQRSLGHSQGPMNKPLIFKFYHLKSDCLQKFYNKKGINRSNSIQSLRITTTRFFVVLSETSLIEYCYLFVRVSTGPL